MTLPAIKYKIRKMSDFDLVETAQRLGRTSNSKLSGIECNRLVGGPVVKSADMPSEELNNILNHKSFLLSSVRFVFNTGAVISIGRDADTWTDQITLNWSPKDDSASAASAYLEFAAVAKNEFRELAAQETLSTFLDDDTKRWDASKTCTTCYGGPVR